VFPHVCGVFAQQKKASFSFSAFLGKCMTLGAIFVLLGAVLLATMHALYWNDVQTYVDELHIGQNNVRVSRTTNGVSEVWADTQVAVISGLGMVLLCLCYSVICSLFTCGFCV